MITRRHFLHGLAGGALATIPLNIYSRNPFAADIVAGPPIAPPQPTLTD